MTDNVHWHIGKEGTMSTALDRGPFRAYFFTTTDGMLIASDDYSETELRAEIHRRISNGENSEPYVAALERLKRI